MSSSSTDSSRRSAGDPVFPIATLLARERQQAHGPTMKRSAGRPLSARLLVVALAAAGVLAMPVSAQLVAPAKPEIGASSASSPSTAYTQQRPSRDGIGKFYMGREIAGVMGFQGASWLERSEREREEGTSLLMTALSLKPGMVVADVGAGTGYLSRRMAKAVTPGGKVLAVDVQPEMVDMLRTLVRETGLPIVPSLGASADVKLPSDSVDLAIMVDVYHELEFPREVLASIVKALKPGGEVVFVEYRAEDPAVPIKSVHKMTETQVRSEAAAMPLLTWEKTIETLPWQHMIVFRKSR